MTTATSNVAPRSKLYTQDYSDPTPANLAAVQSDLNSALHFLQDQQNPTATDVGSGELSGLTLSPGLYTFTTTAAVSDCSICSILRLTLTRFVPQVRARSTLTLDGPVGSVFVIQINGAFFMEIGAVVALTGGVTPSTVFWYITAGVNIGRRCDFSVSSCAHSIVNLGLTQQHHDRRELSSRPATFGFVQDRPSRGVYSALAARSLCDPSPSSMEPTAWHPALTPPLLQYRPLYRHRPRPIRPWIRSLRPHRTLRRPQLRQVSLRLDRSSLIRC